MNPKLCLRVSSQIEPILPSAQLKSISEKGGFKQLKSISVIMGQPGTA